MSHAVKPHAENSLHALAVVISLVLHAAAAVLFHHAKLHPSLPNLMLQEFAWHFRILLGISASLSLLLRVFHKKASLLLIFKIGLFFLITYPLGLELGIFLLLLITLLTEIFAYLPEKRALVYCIISLAVAGALGKPGSAFHYPRYGAGLEELITVGVTVHLRPGKRNFHGHWV